MNEKIKKILSEGIREERLRGFKVGDGVRVHTRIKEGDRERIQAFAGIVIARKGIGNTETFTVRRVVSGEGAEKVFPVHSPHIVKIEVERESLIMRAKLYYMRKRIGKQAMKVKERSFAEKTAAKARQ